MASDEGSGVEAVIGPTASTIELAAVVQSPVSELVPVDMPQRPRRQACDLGVKAHGSLADLVEGVVNIERRGGTSSQCSQVDLEALRRGRRC